MDSEFAHRSRRYAQLHTDDRIARSTSFFAAASIITGAFALGAPTVFMAEVSARLEEFNLDRAERIRRGALYARGNCMANTAHFVVAEQALVQEMLNDLQKKSERAYVAEIDAADCALRVATSAWFPLIGEPLRTLREALRTLRSELDRTPSFAHESERVLIGTALAAACRRPQRQSHRSLAGNSPP